MRTKGHLPPSSAMVAAVPAASCGPSIRRASGSSSASDWSVSNPYMLVVLRLLPSGPAMTPFADMARSAKKRLESSPETREICVLKGGGIGGSGSGSLRHPRQWLGA